MYTKPLKIILTTLSIVLGINCSAIAREQGEYKGIYVAPFAGLYELKQDKKRAMGGLEFQSKQFNKYITPKVGAWISSKSSKYVYAGFNIDLELEKTGVFLIPGFAVGAYGKGDGKDLGGTLEFQSTLELAYQFSNKSRLGISISHLSNAGIYKRNPGVEHALIKYAIPISF